MKAPQLALALPEPELTEQQLRDAHRHCRITRPFEECREAPVLWPLIRWCARSRYRRTSRDPHPAGQ